MQRTENDVRISSVVVFRAVPPQFQDLCRGVPVRRRMDWNDEQIKRQRAATADLSHRTPGNIPAPDLTLRPKSNGRAKVGESLTPPPPVRHLPGLCELEAIPAIVSPPYEAFPLLAY